MIDITVDSKNQKVEVDGKKFIIYTEETMIELLFHIIEQVRYSGEHITLSKVNGEHKVFIKDWY